MAKEIKKIIKEKLEKILDLLGVKADISIKENEKNLFIKLTNTEAALLIGFQGETLFSLQHILRLQSLKELGEESPVIIVDIEDYRKQEEDKLREYIKNTALLVKDTGHAATLRPMSSYKRRIVHLAVQEIPGVVTESYGEGNERRIIIKPEEKD